MPKNLPNQPRPVTFTPLVADGDQVLLEFQSPTIALISRPVPRSARMTTWLVAGLMACSIAVIATYPVDRVVTAQARVISTVPNTVIQPLEVGIIRSINVREGQEVHAGDVLAELDPTFTTADAAGAEAQVVSLQAEVDRLDAEAHDRAYLTDGTTGSNLQAMLFTQRHAERTFKLETYAQKIDGARVKVQNAQADIGSYGQRLQVATQVENKRRELERLQVGSALNTLAALDNRVEIARGLETARAMLEQSRRELDGTIAERDGYLQQARSETAQQLAEQGRRLADVREQFNKARMRNRLVEVRAPQDATVHTIAKVSNGSVLQSGDEFITLVPKNAPVQVEANIAGRDAGFVRVGDTVSVKFDTFSYSTYGTAQGTVLSVSPDSVQNPNMRRSGRPQQDPEEGLGQVFYRARISIDQLNMRNLADDWRPSAGMPVSADIKVGKRTVLSYLLSRVIPTMEEGMREP